ncbi:MAG: glycosyltransferase family 4 protein [Anditalea sp.]
MHIVFNPPINEENKYIEIMVRPLSEHGYQIHALDDIFSSLRHFRSIKLVHLNWFENVEDSSLFRALKSFFRKMFVLSIIRLSKKKLIWTMHNRVSHEKGLSFFSRTITHFLILWSDKIIIHSEISRSLLIKQHNQAADKIFYLPHPDFIDSYGKMPVKNQEKALKAPLALLFIGAVKPYKNLELLIRAVSSFKEEVTLTIAGNPNSTIYQQKISQMAVQAGNINPMLSFIPDNKIPQLMMKSDLLILPYDLSSSLNSGTVLLGFSYKKTVICPEIGTIADLGKMKDNVLHYQYDSEKEHLSMLSQKIREALQMKMMDPTIFISLGNKMHDHVRKVHHKGLVGKKLINLYQSLLD